MNRPRLSPQEIAVMLAEADRLRLWLEALQAILRRPTAPRLGPTGRRSGSYTVWTPGGRR